jgi:hypothetical protein
MESIIVYQLDAQGYYIGEAIADKSPLDDLYLIPAGCVEAEPPAPQEGYRIRFVNGEWAHEDIPEAEEKTYKEALAELNSVYQADVSKLNQSYALALLADGPTEATKLSAIRAQYETRKTQHAAAIAALKLEYGV